jgi:signal transduction histidine kinase
MMWRLGRIVRVALILFIALTAGWIGAIALVYVLYDVDSRREIASAHRVAALVEVMEQASPATRARLASAAGSPVLDVSVTPGLAMNAAMPGRRAADQDAVAAYAAALGDRPFAFGRPAAQSALQQRFPRLAAILNETELRIGLKTGDTLILIRRNPLVLNRLGLPVGLGAGLFGTLVALIALVVMLIETRPLVRLAAAVDRIDLAGPPALLPQVRTTRPEIQALVTAFNRLQVRLAQLLRARMSMLGGISHDVRTFATRLRLRVEQMPDGPERDRAIEDIGDMIHLLDDAVLASRAGAGELAGEMLEFEEIVAGEVNDRRATGAAVDLSVWDATGKTVLGDRVALRRIVANLIDNALKYGQVARLSLQRKGAQLLLLVDDNGPGIPPDQRDMLFEPFVRLETSRNRRTGGAGLGLAIVRSLVEAHGGQISIGDAPGGGARVCVCLPAFPATARS